jgi:hypothetical protein
VTLTGLAVLVLAACGGSPPESVVGPGAWSGDDADSFVALGYGPGNGGTETPAGTGDGICDGTGSGTCDGTAQGPGPHGGQGNGNGPGDGICDGTGSGPGDGSCTGAVVGDDPEDLLGVLVEAIQEERKAETVYRRVITDFGPVAPFAFIAEAEAQHVEAIAQLFERRGFATPESIWNPGNVPVYASITAACAGGVATEIEDGALYEGYLSRDDLPSDVVNVFTHLQAASLENHLPAFERCQ